MSELTKDERELMVKLQARDKPKADAKEASGTSKAWAITKRIAIGGAGGMASYAGIQAVRGGVNLVRGAGRTSDEALRGFSASGGGGRGIC